MPANRNRPTPEEKQGKHTGNIRNRARARSTQPTSFLRMSTVSVHISERIATITLNRPKSLNSISTEGSHLVTLAIDFSDFTLSLTLDYDAFANALREIDAREEVLVTVWQGASPTTDYTTRISFVKIGR